MSRRMAGRPVSLASISSAKTAYSSASRCQRGAVLASVRFAREVSAGLCFLAIMVGGPHKCLNRGEADLFRSKLKISIFEVFFVARRSEVRIAKRRANRRFQRRKQVEGRSNMTRPPARAAYRSFDCWRDWRIP